MHGDTPPSQLFSVRFWPEALSDGRMEWRGKVQHVLSGEAHYFRTLQELVGRLSEMLATLGGSATREDPTPTGHQQSAND